MPECRLCGASELKQSVRGDFVFGGTDEHKFWQCEDCDAVYLLPIPSEEEEAKFYRQEFEKYMSTRVGDHRDWSNAEAHIQTNQDQVVRRMGFMDPYVKPGLDVLEIGCSSGVMIEGFKSAGMNATGVEPSGEFLQFLKSNGHECYKDIEDISPSRKFDLITHFFLFLSILEIRFRFWKIHITSLTLAVILLQKHLA